MWTLDFETKAIENGSDRSPVPVGVALKHDGEPSQYLCWGHPTQNNCSYSRAKITLEQLWNQEILCHNTKFDLRVASEHFGLPVPKVFHDTLFLAFIYNPRDESLGLKPLSDKYLSMPPEEQDLLRDWIVENVKKANSKNFGAYISEAPGDLVGSYARGDVNRTYLLYKFYTGEIDK